MKNVVFLLFFAFLFCACASRGHFVRAEHNGKIYWLPPQCEYYTPAQNDEQNDKIVCRETGELISPTTPAEYEAYLKEREIRSIENNMAFGDPWYYGEFYSSPSIGIFIERRPYFRHRHYRHFRPYFRDRR